MRLAFAAAIFVAAATSSSAQQPAEPGARIFQRCFACHSLDPAERNLSGPTLKGVFGRVAGTLDGFEFSAPMREAGARGLAWSPETLDRYLADPEAMIAGGLMAGLRLQDDEERRVLIEWLQRMAR